MVICVVKLVSLQSLFCLVSLFPAWSDGPAAESPHISRCQFEFVECARVDWLREDTFALTRWGLTDAYS